MFYEADHSLTEGYLRVTEEKNLTFPAHLHEAFECIVVTGGSLKATIDRECYTLLPGEAVLIFPNQVHAFITEKYSTQMMVIFSPDQVKAYMPICASRIPKNNAFRPSDGLMAGMRSLWTAHSVMQIKSVLYALTDAFHQTAVYTDVRADNEMLLPQIFSFVSQNYAQECTLKRLSRALSYHYVYLSRYFTEKTGLSFSYYVNRYRIGESCYRLTNSQDSVTKIAMECGYNSLRSFHRNFYLLLGKTPREYRNAHLKKMEE